MSYVSFCFVFQALVVLEAQDKDSLVVILVVDLLLLEATQVTLEDLAILRQATLGVEVLQGRPDLATLVGGPILRPKAATLRTAIPKEDLEVTHPQVYHQIQLNRAMVVITLEYDKSIIVFKTNCTMYSIVF